MRRFQIFPILLNLFFLVPWLMSSSWGEITLPSLVTDNMVLQQGHRNPIWGWAEPGEAISIAIGGHVVKTTAQTNGAWRAALPKMTVHKEPLEMVVSGANGSQVTVANILVGEVWLVTGPSNIFWPVNKCDDAKQEIATANYPNIRFFTVQKNTADKPQTDCEGNWFLCSPETVGDVSGIGYFFVRRLHNDLEVPVGVLQSFWGGSRIEAWTSIEALRAQPQLKPILEWWKNARQEYNAGNARAEYEEQLAKWKLAAQEARSKGKEAPKKPAPPEDPAQSRHRPACLYNGMVAPLIPYGIRGVVCYQGLGNLFWAEYSRSLLATQIRDWRNRWDQGDFPVCMVQPAPYPCDQWSKQLEDAYSVSREAQLLILDEVPNTGVAPTTDIGDLTELHFTNKQAVARRVALWALSTVYGQSLPFAGPIYKAMTVEDGSLRIHFRNTGKGLATRDGKPPTHFSVAGDDNVFHPAQARMDGHTVVVYSKKVDDPVSVRFAWGDTAIPNLINSDGLPASLFRSDGHALPTRE